MFELTETNPPVDVQESEYQRLLGYPKNHTMGERARELADAARKWYSANGRPWIYAREIDALELTGETVRIAGYEFSSKALHDSLAGAKAHSAVLVVVSAGKECEDEAGKLWRESKPDEYFFMEVFGSAVVESLITMANGRICGWGDQHNMAVLPHYSPGYSGWDIADQVKLSALIRLTNGGNLPGQLEVMETGMLRPTKSLLAVVGLTRDREIARRFARLIPCENCSLPRCQYRRASYQHTPPQIEDVRLLHNFSDDNAIAPAKHFALNRNAKYTVNPRALQKWSQERLRLEILPDGLIEAHFLYEGTTCTNLGRGLEFEYRVKLGAAHDDYKILEANCAPAPGDTGHTQQCAYLADASALMASIAAEKPLLGQPLNSVLAWERGRNPSGCFCDLERRQHKWGLVFEVIHFALAQQETEMADGQSSGDSE